MNSFTRFFRSMLLVLLMVWLPNVVMADGGKLQATLDNLSQSLTRSTNDAVYDIDLSKMSDEDKLLTTTLEVRNGLHVRFINGTLTRTADATGPMVRVTNSSILEIGKDAIFFNNGTDHTHGAFSTPNTSPVVSLVKGNVIVSSNGQIRMESMGTKQEVSRTNIIIPVSKEEDVCVNVEGEDCSVDIKENAYIDGTLKSSCKTLKINVHNGFVDYINILGKSSELNIWGGKIGKVASYSHVAIFGGTIGYVSLYACNVYLSGETKHIDLIMLYDGSEICVMSALNETIKTYVYGESWSENDIIAFGVIDYQLTTEDIAKIDLTWRYNNSYQNLNNNKVLEDNKLILKKQSLSSYLQSKFDEIAANGTSSKNSPIAINTPLPSSVTNVIDEMVTVPSNCYVTLSGLTMSVSKTIPQDLVFSVEANAGITFNNVTFDGSEITKCGYWFRLADKTSAVTVGTGCEFKIPGCGTEKYTQESNFSLCSGDGTFTYQSGVFSSLQPATKGDGNIMIAGGEIYSKSTVVQTGSFTMTDGSLYGGYGSSDYIVQTSKLLVQGGEIHSLKKNNIIFADCDIAEISAYLHSSVDRVIQRCSIAYT